VKYLGLDGCKAGWFLVGLNEDLSGSFGILESISELSEYLDDAELVLVDVSVGLRRTESDERLCDKEARRLLGRRGSSVFPAPSRCALESDSYETANARNRECTGRGLSKQSWAIVPKIREVDRYLRTESRRRLIREMHPEVCFWALNRNRPMAHNKKTEAGFTERIALLERHLPAARHVVNAAMDQYPRKRLARDDIVDALVGATVAAIDGELKTVPEQPEIDEAGLPMEMVCRLPSAH
jgi:predicted RNase H-like nuclease